MKQRRHIVAQAIAQKTLHVRDRQQLAKEIAAFLIHEDLLTELDSLLRDVVAIRADQGIVEAEAVSAHILSDTDIRDIRAVLQEAYPNAKELTIHQRIDNSLVGGVKLVMPHQQLDESVRAQISKFKLLTSERA